MEIASVDSARAKGSVSPWGGTRNMGCNNAYSPLQVPSYNEVAKGQKKCVVVKGEGYVRVPVIDFTVH